MADLRGIRAGEVCSARTRRSDVARPSSTGYPRRVRERRWRYRHATAQKVPARDKGRGLAQAVGDCRRVLVPRASGSQRMEPRARYQTLQGKVLGWMPLLL